MNRKPFMPKATAVWLVENTALTFEQIAEFCGLHLLEVKSIADGQVASNILGMDPIADGTLTQEEIEKCLQNPKSRLQMRHSIYDSVVVTQKHSTKYTPIARRREKPNAIFWILKYYPEMTDSQIVKLIGTTKNTIQAIRDKVYWNMKNLKPQDPILLGICSQIELDVAINVAMKKRKESKVEDNANAN